MAVPEANHVGVIAVGGSQRQNTEVVHAVRRGCMMFFEQLVAEEPQAVFHHLDDAVMRNRDMGVSGSGCWQCAQSGIVERFAARMEHQGHAVLLEQGKLTGLLAVSLPVGMTRGVVQPIQNESFGACPERKFLWMDEMRTVAGLGNGQPFLGMKLKVVKRATKSLWMI